MDEFEEEDCQHNWNYGDDARWCLGCGTFELGGFR